MLAKYDENLMFKFYNIFKENLNRAIANIKYEEPIDPLMKLILLNNSCKILEENEVFSKDIELDNNIYISFVNNMLGNDANEYYDYITFNGSKYFIIFIDYFKDTVNNAITVSTEDEIKNTLHSLMGLSVVYDAITKLVDVLFYNIIDLPLPGTLLTTCTGKMQRFNASIVAIHILDQYKYLTTDDIPNMRQSDIDEICNGMIQLQLYGIRQME